MKSMSLLLIFVVLCGSTAPNQRSKKNRVPIQEYQDGVSPEGSRCRKIRYDIVFKLDSSIFLQEDDFENTKSWLKKFVSSFEIGQNATRVAFLFFDKPNYFIPMNEFYSAYNLLETIKTLNFENGSAAKTIDMAALNLRNSNVQKVDIIITNNENNYAPPGGENSQVLIYFVAIGDRTSNGNTKPPSGHYQVSDMSSIESIRSSLRRLICIESICPNKANPEHVKDDLAFPGFDVFEEISQNGKNYETMFDTDQGKTNNFLSISTYVNSTNTLFPFGLPDQYTIVAVFESNAMVKYWRIIEILDSNGRLQMGVKMDYKNLVFTFYTIDVKYGLTKAKFDTTRFPRLNGLFKEGIHKIVVEVNTNSILLHADCVKIGLRKMKSKDSSIAIDGKTLVGSNIGTIHLYKLRIYCNSDIVQEATCCEIKGHKQCPQRTKTMRDMAVQENSVQREDNIVEKTQLLNCRCEKGDMGAHGIGYPGADGEPGYPGATGSPGIPGAIGPEGRVGYQGPTGPKGEKGECIYMPRSDKSVPVVQFLNDEPPSESKFSTRSLYGDKLEILEYDNEDSSDLSDGQNASENVKNSNFLDERFTQATSNPLMNLKGEKGEKGSTGSNGRDGNMGVHGDAGVTGLTGPIGHSGKKGQKGEIGLIGLNGITGHIGPPGLSGVPGVPGVKGEPGRNGSNGAPGMDGYPGSTGVQGPKGDTGIDGTAGTSGPVGPEGPQGIPGKKGNHGLPGQNGIGLKGNKGDPGPRGMAGVNGVPGYHGRKGNPGIRGPKGQQGLSGRTGHAGQKGRPGIKGDGGSLGEKGETGAAGTPGMNGVNGRSSPIDRYELENQIMEIVDVKIEQNLEKRLKILMDRRMEDIINEVVKRAIPELTYAMIQNGYQNDQPIGINVDEMGSLVLKGPVGPKGDPGLPGLDGLQGRPGDPGVRGDKGDAGKKGDRGKGGRDGRGDYARLMRGLPAWVKKARPVGKPGPRGPPGQPGEAGVHGSNGEPGRDGRPGDPGHCDLVQCYQTAERVSRSIFETHFGK